MSVKKTLHKTHPDPFSLFGEWYNEAEQNAAIKCASAMCLATATLSGKPSNRMVLLKGFDTDGFVFYTNLESRKGEELEKNPNAALCFYWEPIGKQVRIEGRITPISDQEADSYFASRPLKTRIGAWASKQSRPMRSTADLLRNVAKCTAKFALKNIPRPPYWSGFRVVPHTIEFWCEGEFRLHQRLVYRRTKDATWKTDYLFP